MPQLPECPPEWPAIAWPVDPKPPRAVEEDEEDDEDDDDADGLAALPPEFDRKPTEVEFDGRPELVDLEELELEYQCQPRDELEERRHGSCCAAGCAPGDATPCCAGGCWRQFAFGSM